MKLRLEHIGLVSETDEQNQQLADFFSGVLGLEVSGNAAEGYAEIRLDALTISLHRGNLIDQVTPHGGTLLQFHTDDLRSDLAEIRSRGGDIVLEPTATDWGSTSAYIAGPHGVLVELYQLSN
jgi:predicted enzyme related to lactoylglutathione lyase